MAHKKIGFAILGCGHIGKRHAQMIVNNPEAELMAMSDVMEQSELGIDDFEVPFYSSFEDMLMAEEGIDVVCICTPNGLHSEQAIKALESGKHVVCEKPMGLTKSRCEEVIYKSLQMNKRVFCVMQNRYSPPSVWLKEMVDSQKLGDIYMVQADCYWNRDKRYYKPGRWKGSADLDGGTLFTQFSHFIDLMYWVFGDISNIQGKFKDFNHEGLTAFEDSGFVNFDFVRGGMGAINYSTALYDKNFESSMTIIAEKGTVKVGGQYMNEVIYCHVKDYEMPVLPQAAPPNDYGTYKGSAANHHFVIENVVETLRERETATTNALEGLKVVEIIQRIYEVRDEQVNREIES
ncbi:MAG: Gfo/Idh/MocA family oxidoreductase [Flavobacteriales bacterium]|nr:Gfo/Idh/MocA family oxidoreductase [Flavobacteriales bacterium]NNK80514.1 Gfo/Idh/MocA family oxidoreductase [Flavobacteriales bacterium]